MTTEEAAKYLKYTTSYVCQLIKSGKISGAKKISQKAWLIPKTSIFDYKPGLQGFAAINAKKRAEAQEIKNLFSIAVKSAKERRAAQDSACKE